MAAPASMPWSVKGVSLETRLAAKEAAHAAGLTVGEWLCGVIRSTAADEQASRAVREGGSLIERAVARIEADLASASVTPVPPAAKG